MNADSKYDEYSGRGFLADATVMFAAVLLLVASGFSFLQGASAIANDDLYSAGSDYLYRFDMNVWGTVQLVLAVLGFAVAIGIFRGASWAMVGGMIIVGFSMLTNFAFIPRYPWWSITIIALDLLLLWALSAQLGRPRK